MKKLEIYNGQKTYMFPNGELATPDKILEHFPAATNFTHIIETDEGGEVAFAVQNLSAMRSIYEVPVGLARDEAVRYIEGIINAPVETEPTAEERIAAALEFQNIMSL